MINLSTPECIVLPNGETTQDGVDVNNTNLSSMISSLSICIIESCV